MRARYETFCGGRLLKVTERIYVGGNGPHAELDPGDNAREWIDGQFHWEVDETRVADDVAQAMLAKWSVDHPSCPPSPAGTMGGE